MVINLNQKKELISKAAILSEYNDIDVFRLYLEPGQDAIPGTFMLSPLRKESRPSFGFFQGDSGEICFKDHLLGGGDFVRFVQMKFGLTYFEALSKIATDLGINDRYICKNMTKTSSLKDNLPSREEILSKVTSLRLGKNRRRWQEHDKEYWTQFGITLETLKRFRVEPIMYIHVNGRIFKADKHAYCFTEIKDGVETYKIYQPFNKDFKWINGHNDSVWQGWEQLPPVGTELIITKSLKDVMALWDVLQIPAVSLQSENVIPKHHVFQQLNDRFDVKYSLYDNDYDKEINWGKKFGDKIAEQFGLITLYIPEQYQSKDFSDLVKNVGKDKAREILTKEMMIPF